MGAPKMHADEVDVDAGLVRRLLERQFPQWAGSSLRPVRSAGTDNAIYRLGHRLGVRLPRRQSTVAQVEKEHMWLPRLAPHLPFAVPVPLAIGAPGEGYPWPWSIMPWLPGEPATPGHLADPRRAGAGMARFVAALQEIDAAAGPPPGDHNFGRGVPLADRDHATRAAIRELSGMLDPQPVTTAWDAAVRAPVWQGPPRWIHGDLLPGNILIAGDRISAVVDFGGLAVGDPACDLMVAWTLFSGDSRQAFRDGLTVDDATWARGRGWALSWALIFIPYYLDTNPSVVRQAWRTVHEVLGDCQTGGPPIVRSGRAEPGSTELGGPGSADHEARAAEQRSGDC
ncbi:MAG: aminoglycoside phosphotransferase family protein [Streptosporangiaceae bacterium]|nr:aminoglycoside phosphotransferase family protein [Streptosporangiaceae bacterium]